MAFTDFDVWVHDEHSSQVIQQYDKGSAVDRAARKVTMSSSVQDIPRSDGFDITAVAKGAAYGEDDGTGDVVTLRARKAGGIKKFAVEDLNDSKVDLLATKRHDAAVSMAKFFDNATVGTSAAENGTTVLYTSVYKAVKSNDAAVGYTADANYMSGAVTYANLNSVLSLVENSDYNDDLIWILSPIFKGLIRGLLDGENRPLLQNVLVDGFTQQTLLGYPVEWAKGARVSAVNTDKPTGNHLAVVASRPLLIEGVANLPGLTNGVPGYAFQGPAQGDGFNDDTAKMKAAMRRAFVVGNVNGVAVFEKTS